MMNLFTVFDPVTFNILSLNWLSMIYTILFLPMMFWFIPSRWNMFIYLIVNFLIEELALLMNNKINLMNMLIYISIFFFIMLNNFLGIFNYIFTSTSHLVITLSMSLSLWISYMIYGWFINMNHMFTHLVPIGTPFILMPFMVMIETISNLIRPITLSVRLAANMIAGHLLMTLLSSLGPQLSFIMLMIMLLIQMILITLELSVAIIQAYVFTVLSSLYSTESNYEKN